ncbi:MAG TPA: hypothetical protein PL182_07335, partial [Pseudobdellovibrionaceae bacterium]|nr:hypothetical protein [Pseudobdellovibrionaceae bacterium]
MSGNEEGSPVDGSLMRQCIQRNLARTTYEAIENSRLYGVLRDRQYRLWLPDGNGFMAQESETRDFTVNGWDSSRKKDPVTRFGGNRLAVAETTLQAGSNFLKGAVPMNGGFKVTGPAPSQELEKEAQGRLADSKSRKEKAEKSLADLRNEKSDMEREKRQAEDRLSGERAKPSGSQDSGLISRLEREISDLKSKIDQLTKVRIPEAESRIESAEKDIREAQLFIDEIRDWKERPALITMTVLPVRQENYVQPHKADLKIEIENPQNLREPWGARIDQILAGVTAYDPAFFEGTLIVSDLLHRDRVTGYAKMRYDTASKTYLLPPGLSVSASSGPVTDQPEDNTNYGKIDKQCEEAGSTAGGSSFGKASWDYSFAANTRHSWNFAGASGSTDETDPLLSELVFDRLNSSIAMGTATFQVRSIVGKCIVKATAEFVTGFLTCDDFIVEPRTMPLRIIGT